MFSLKSFHTNYQTNPLGIYVKGILFDWQYEFSEDVLQKSYRVVVAATKENAKNGIGDVWDSGVVLSSKSSGVEYGGKELDRETIYYVKLFTTSINGETAESNVNTFETCTYDSIWKDEKWCFTPGFMGADVLCRTDFGVPEDGEIERARIYVCGIGACDVYINGIMADDDVLSPILSEYEKTIYYRTYDITNLLHKGSNAIGLDVGNGWFLGRKFKYSILLIMKDGRRLRANLCFGVMVTTGPRINNGIYDGEVYDANLAKKYEKWNLSEYKPTFDDGWIFATLCAPPKADVLPAPCEPMRMHEVYYPASEKKFSDNIIVYDMAQNMTGFAELKVKGKKGASVELKFTELVKKDGRADRINLRAARCTDKYILCGEGEETYIPRFTYHGFRYIEAEITGEAEILGIKAIHVGADTAATSEFSCSDEIINKLHYISAYTEKNNEVGTLTDCPQRDERFGWMNDWSARFFQTVYNFDMSRYFPKVLKDVTDGQTEKGEISDTAPYFTGGTPADPVSVSYLLLADMSYKMYGNASVIKEFYPNLKAWVDYLLTRYNGTVMDYTYYNDWVQYPFPGEVGTDGIFVSTAFLIWHLKLLAKFAGIAGIKEDEAKYSKLEKDATAKFNEQYFKNGMYNNGTQCEIALPLSLGFAPEEFKSSLAKALNDSVVSHNNHNTCGNQGYRHSFEMLSEYGYGDTVINVLKNPEYPGWGYMIANGATTVWERWESEGAAEMNSFDHPMFGSYDAWIMHRLGGIGVADNAEGANILEIKPDFVKSLSHVQAKYKSINGDVSVKWARENGIITLEVIIPSNTKAVIIAGGKEENVLSGKHTMTFAG